MEVGGIESSPEKTTNSSERNKQALAPGGEKR